MLLTGKERGDIVHAKGGPLCTTVDKVDCTDIGVSTEQVETGLCAPHVLKRNG